MSENNNKGEVKNQKRKNKRKSRKTLRRRNFFNTLVSIILILMIGIGAVTGIVVLSILKDVPEIDPTNISASLDQTSFILTPDGELIEKIQAPELRTVVDLEEVPQHLQDAFIAIEDERFESHIGVDPRGIIASAVDNIKAGKIVRGASTITQQLVKNVYLTREKSWNRKIKEAYLALKVERTLSKDQIMELYLNRIFLGQNAYGVQEASQVYFSKDVGELTIAESALIAGIAKSSARFAPYETIKLDNFNPDSHDEVAKINMNGEKYVAVYNPESIERQHIVLNQMLELGKITQEEYNQAISEDIKSNLKPAERKLDGISSYFADTVKTQVVEVLMDRLDYTEEEAQKELYAGGLKIYSTIDVELQKKLEDTYNNFTEVLVGNPNSVNGPILIDWRLDGASNIVDKNGNILYYTKGALFNDHLELKISNDEYRFEDDNLIINSNKLKSYKSHIDVADFYDLDEKKNLRTYPVGSINIDSDLFDVNSNNELVIKSDFLNENEEFLRIDENGSLLINNEYFSISEKGTVQPQSATVVLDYRNGHIKAIVGGRDVEGERTLNRATDSQRQPGSVMKPIAAYLPALDNGYTAATAIDDVPFYSGGKLWPKNWYADGYRGIYTLRRALEQSANVPSVKVVDDIGIDTSLKYLAKMGIINKSDPNNDSFITAEEDPSYNDENLSALGLGGMTNGLTPLEVTAAFGTIANDGEYIEPLTFYKIEDKNGNILIDDTKKTAKVLSPQKAYILKDILRTTVTDGIAGKAQVPGMATGGKTGTTQNQADIWFVGFTPYYATGVWIGNDSPAITISEGSGAAASLWRHIMIQMHDGLESKTAFDKPDGIVSANVCRDSGLIPTALCSSDPRGGRVYTEIFAEGTVPTRSCDVHIQANICSVSGQLATEYCPSSSVRGGAFLRTNYNPSKNGGITPTDYKYRAPVRCTIHNANTPQTQVDENINIEDDTVEDEQQDSNDEGTNEETEKDDEVTEPPSDNIPVDKPKEKEDEEKDNDN